MLDLVLSLLQNNLLTNKIELDLRLAHDLPRVRGDSGELQQVFFNLVNNAAAAMPQGGKLTVMTRVNLDNHMVEAVIADTGTGIPKEIADRIFDPFFTTKKMGEGTGLGLSVSYAIVNKYGGNIRFETRLPEADGVIRARHFLSACHLKSRWTPEKPNSKEQLWDVFWLSMTNSTCSL